MMNFEYTALLELVAKNFVTPYSHFDSVLFNIGAVPCCLTTVCCGTYCVVLRADGAVWYVRSLHPATPRTQKPPSTR